MACINPDGTLHPVAKKVLEVLVTPRNMSEIAAASGVPLYRVRASLRELSDTGFITTIDDRYVISDKGKSRLN